MTNIIIHFISYNTDKFQTTYSNILSNLIGSISGASNAENRQYGDENNVPLIQTLSIPGLEFLFRVKREPYDRDDAFRTKIKKESQD